MKRFSVAAPGAVALLIGAALATTAPAAALIWDATPGNGQADDGSGTWDAGGSNWWAGATNVLWNSGAPDSATFGGAGGSNAYAVVLGADITASGLTFAGQAYTIAPDGGNLYALALAGSATVTAATNGTISARVSGAAGLIKDGAGTLTLSGANTYSGGTTISAGTLSATAAAIGATGSITLNGGTFKASAPGSFPNNFVANNVAGNAIDITAGVVTLSGNLSGSGNLALKIAAAGNTTQLSGDNTAYAGTVTIPGGYGPYFNSPGATSSNAAWVVNSTWLALNGGTGVYRFGALAGSASIWNGSGTATLEVGALGLDTTYSGYIQNGGSPIALQKIGSGTLKLTRANAFSGGTTVNGGTLVVGATGALGSGAVVINKGAVQVSSDAYNSIGVAVPLTVNTNGVLSANNATNNAQNIGPITLNGGTLASANGPAGPANDGGFGNWLLRGITVGGSAASTISAATLWINSGAFSVADAVAGTDLLVSSKIIGGFVNKVGAGTLELTGNNTYASGTMVNGGTLRVAQIADSGTSNIGVAGGATNWLAIYSGTLQYTGAGSNSTTRSVWVDQGNTKTGTVDVVEATGQLTLTPGTGVINANLVKAGAGALVLNAAISGAGSVTVKAGTLTLGRAGSYTGGTTLSGGTLAPANAAGLGSGVLTMNGGTLNLGALAVAGTTVLKVLNGGTITGSPGWLYLGAGGMDASAATGDLTFTPTGLIWFNTSQTWRVKPGRTVTFSSAGGGAGGTLTVSGGGTVVETVGLNAGSGTGLGMLSVGSNTVYRLSGTAFNMLAAQGAGWLPITIGNGGILTADNLIQNAHNIGALTLTGGTLTSVNGPAGPANNGGWGNFILRGVTVGGSALSTISPTTLEIFSGSFTVADVVAGTDLLVSSAITVGAVTKDGPGTMALTGANTYAGGTTVNGGTLLVNNAAGSGTGSGTVAVGPGGTLGGSGTIAGAVSVGAGGALAPGETNATAVLRISNNVTLASGAVFHVDLNGPAAGAQYDQLSVTAGSLQCDDATLAVTVGTGYTPPLGTAFTVVTSANAIGGNFAGLADGRVLAPAGSPVAFVVRYDNASDPKTITLTTARPSSGTVLIVR